MSGVWVVVDENGEPVIETPNRIEAEDHMQPGYQLDWQEKE